MGFMPPEQMFNRQLTTASDLYGLGATLICLLTGTKSVDVGNLIDDNYSIHFRHLVPPLQQGWMNWLDRMVAPRLQDRYKSAADALAVLQSLDVSRLPKVRLERDTLEFTATEYGETITKIIEISNPIPDTILSGRWEVTPHPNDPPHKPYDHPWISFEPQKFESNNLACQIIVDTKELLAIQTYERQIILQTNSAPDTYKLKIKVTTATLPIPEITSLLSKKSLIFMCCFVLFGFLFNMGNNYDLAFCIIASLVFGFAVAEITIIAESNRNKGNWMVGLSVALIGLISSQIWVSNLINSGYLCGKCDTIFESIFTFIVRLLAPITFSLCGAALGIRMNWMVAIIVQGFLFSFYSQWAMYQREYPWVAFFILLTNFCCMIVYMIFKNPIDEQTTLRRIINIGRNTIAFLIAGFCTSLGVGFRLFFNVVAQREWVEPMEILAVGGATIASLAVTAIPLLDMLVFKPNRLLAKYRKSESYLIKA